MPSHPVVADAFVVVLHLILIPNFTAASDLPYLSQYWPDLSLYIGPAPTGNVHESQNFTYCCARALDHFYANGQQNSTDISVASTFSNKTQFPCGASYQGDHLGAPTVKISYNWCSTHCSGWQISQSSKLTQWLQPFVGFILPAIVFALNVPRRRKLQLPDWVFPKDIADPLRFLFAIACTLVAALIVAMETIIWLFVVFALAGPLLLSGLYEAWIDKRIIDFVSEKIENNHLPLPLRVRILVAVLVGNLDQDTAWEPSMSVAASLDPYPRLPDEPEELARRKRSMHDVQARLRSMIACQYSFGSTIGAPIVFYIGSFVYAIIETKSQLGDNDTSHALAFGMWWMSIPHIAIVSGCLLAGNNPNTLEAIVPHSEVVLREDRPSWLLRNTVNIRQQANKMFGSTYDAKHKPAWMWDRGRSKRSWLLRVCREYSAEDPNSLKKLTKRLEMGPGDWAIVSTLAFLLFFIPCLFGFLTSYYTPQIGLACRSITFLLYACSQTWLLHLWIWNFTWRDKDWRQRPRDEEDHKSTPQPVILEDVPNTIEPVVLAADPTETDIITAVNPTAEPNVRATLTQDYSPAPPYNDNATTSPLSESKSIRSSCILSLLAKARWFPSRESLEKSAIIPNADHLSRAGFVLFWFLMSIGFLGAILSAIGGTMMQIIGVYRNCLCMITGQTWTHERDKANLIISTSSELDINQAAHFWIPMGVAAACFLGVVAYVAWWYQRRLRMLFGELVGQVGTSLPKRDGARQFSDGLNSHRADMSEGRNADGPQRARTA